MSTSSTTIEASSTATAPAIGVGMAKAANPSPATSPISTNGHGTHGSPPPLPAVEPIQDRIANLRHQLELAEQEEKRRTEAAKVARLKAAHERIDSLPAVLEEPDLLGVIHRIAEVAGIEVRLYRLGSSQRKGSISTVSPVKAGKKAGSTHTKGFRLTDHQREQILQTIRAGNYSVADLKRRFNVAGQTVYTYVERVRKEAKSAARAAQKAS